MRALSAEKRRRPIAWLIALVVIGAWVTWAALARVGVHVSSVAGRVEAVEPVHILRAEVAGRLVAVHAQFGHEVHVGDVLFEIDAAESDIKRAEATARASSLQAEHAVLEAAVTAANEAKASGQDVLYAALAESRARVSQARTEQAQAERELARVTKLGDDVVSVQERDRFKSAVATRRAEVVASQALADKLSAEEAREASDRTAAVERMRQELIRLDGTAAALQADAQTADVALERRRVRVPVAGRLGDVPTLRPGDYVEVGQALGTIVPSGALHVVAWFPAERALGWVHAGELARLRLDAFPWTWFGQIEAHVSDVALEPSEGLLRVELALVEPMGADIPLRHGLTGGVEIEVEETTPLALLLRAAGRQTHDSSAPGPVPQAP